MILVAATLEPSNISPNVIIAGPMHIHAARTVSWVAESVKAYLTTILLFLAATSVEAGPLFTSVYRSFPTGPDPWSVCIADFNEDGLSDLAVAGVGA